MNEWQVSEVRFTPGWVSAWNGDGVLFDYLKFNEAHDELGRFATTDGGASTAALAGTPLDPATNPATATAAKTLSGLVAKYPEAGHPLLKPDDVTGDTSMARRGGDNIYLSPQLFNPEGLAAYEKEWDGLAVDSTAAGVVNHEFGHLLAGKLEEHLGPDKFWDTVYKWYDLPNAEGRYDVLPSDKVPSPYAQENIFENVAETFSTFETGKTATNAAWVDDIKRRADGMWGELLYRARTTAPYVAPVPKRRRAKKYNPNHDALGRFATADGGPFSIMTDQVPGMFTVMQNGKVIANYKSHDDAKAFVLAAIQNAKPKGDLPAGYKVVPAGAQGFKVVNEKGEALTYGNTEQLAAQTYVQMYPQAPAPSSGYKVTPVSDESTGIVDYQVTYQDKPIGSFNNLESANSYANEHSLTTSVTPPPSSGYQITPNGPKNYVVTQQGKPVGEFGDLQAANDFVNEHSLTTSVAAAPKVTAPIAGEFKLTPEHLPESYTTAHNFGTGGADVLNGEGLSVSHGNTVQQAATNYFNGHPEAALPEGYSFIQSEYTNTVLDDHGNAVWVENNAHQPVSQSIENFLNSPKAPAAFNTATGVAIQTKPLSEPVQTSLSLDPATGATVYTPTAKPTIGAEHLPSGYKVVGDKDTFAVLDQSGYAVIHGNTEAEALQHFYSAYPEKALPPGYTIDFNPFNQSTSIMDASGNVVHQGPSDPNKFTYDVVAEYLSGAPSSVPSTGGSKPAAFVPGEEHLPAGVQLKGNQAGYSSFKVVGADSTVLGAGNTKEEALNDYFTYHANTLLPAGYQVGYDHIADVPTILDADGIEVWSGKAGQSGYSGVVDYLTQNPSLIPSTTATSTVPFGYKVLDNGSKEFDVWHLGSIVGTFNNEHDAKDFANEHALSNAVVAAHTPAVDQPVVHAPGPTEADLPAGVHLVNIEPNEMGGVEFKVYDENGKSVGGYTRDEAVHNYFIGHPEKLLPEGYKVDDSQPDQLTHIIGPNGLEVHVGTANDDIVTTIQDWKAQGAEVTSLANVGETYFGPGRPGLEPLGQAGLPPKPLSEQRGDASEFTATTEAAPPSQHQVTADEKQTVSSYTGSGNSALNKMLRDGIKPDYPGDVSENLKNLDAIFKDTSTEKEMTLYRGISANAQKKLDDAIAHNDGHFVDKGFVSTSKSESVAHGWKSGTYVTIKVPAGSKALDVEHPKVLTSHPGEQEWIIARDQHFIVRKDESSKYHYDAHYFLTLVNPSHGPPKDTRQIEFPFIDHGPVNKQDEPYDPSEKFTWEESHIVPGNPDVEKYNEAHDALGRFATTGGQDTYATRAARFMQRIKGELELGVSGINPNPPRQVAQTPLEGLDDSPELPMVMPHTPPSGPLVFHGTSQEAIDSIEKYGLVARGGAGADQWAQAHPEFFSPGGTDPGIGQNVVTAFANKPANLFFAANPETAIMYAKFAAQANGSTPVVFPVHLTQGMADQLVWDTAGAHGEMKLDGEMRIPSAWLGKPAVGDAGMAKLLAGYYRLPDDYKLNSDTIVDTSRPPHGGVLSDLPASDAVVREIMGKAEQHKIIFMVLFVDGVEKYNMVHGYHGYFASGPGGGFGDAEVATMANPRPRDTPLKLYPKELMVDYDPEELPFEWKEYTDHARGVVPGAFKDYEDFKTQLAAAPLTHLSEAELGSMVWGTAMRFANRGLDPIRDDVVGRKSQSRFDRIRRQIEHGGMEPPIVLKTNDGTLRLGGNTRMSMAAAAGYNVPVKLIDVRGRYGKAEPDAIKFNVWHDLLGMFTSEAGASGHGSTGSAEASATTISELLHPHGTEEQRAAVQYYTDEGYRDVNAYLRHGEEPTTPAYTESTIKHLDEVMAHSELPKETTVYRGLASRAVDRLEAALASGQTRFIDKGFISTSADEHYAEVFAASMLHDHATAEIVLPKGAHARNIANWSSSPDEQEVLVARGSAFKIERKSIDNDTDAPRYHLRLLPDYDPNQLDLPLNKLDSMSDPTKYMWTGDEMLFFAEKYNHEHDPHTGEFASAGGSGGAEPTVQEVGDHRFSASRPLSKEEKLAVGFYTATTGYREINSALRRGFSLKNTPETQAHADNLAAAIDTQTLTEPVTVYRGIRNDGLINKFNQAVVTGNNEFTDKGFPSTSLSQHAALGFTSQYQDSTKYMMRINLPKGAHALPASSMGLGARDEDEVILQHGSRFRITGRNDEGGQVVYDADLVN